MEATQADFDRIPSDRAHVTTPVRGYGDLILKTHYYPDSSMVRAITVEHADDLIAISAHLLTHIEPRFIRDDGYLVADTAGEYVYRPVRFAEQGRVVVCERVR